jgi:hypothetical protein
MAFVYADRVKETTQTHSGTTKFLLAGAATGYRTFVAGVGSTNTCPYVAEGATAGEWECGIGTVTDAATDELERTTVLSSSNSGSLVNFTSGVHTVFCDWSAGRAQQATLEHVAGTDADTTMTVGQMYVVDMSAWATADRNYTLPATAAVGDRIGVMISAGDASHELILKANTGDTLNGVSAAEWSRLFITGEVVIMRCVAASATWIVEYDGRIPQTCLMRLSTSASAETTSTWTPPTTKSGVWTADHDVGNIAGTSADKITVRRAGKYLVSAGAISATQLSDRDNFGVGLWKNGTQAGGGTLVVNHTGDTSTASSSYASLVFSNMSVPLATDDYLVYHYYVGSSASKGLLGHASPRVNSSFTVTEVL